MSNPNDFDLSKLEGWRIAVIGVLVLFTIYVFYVYFTKSSTTEMYCNQSGQCGNRVIIMWSASWCPYCQSMKPIFQQVMNDLSSTGIQFSIKEDDPNRPNYVNSFPTIMMYDSGKMMKYTGLQNYQQLMLWCQSISQTEYQN